MDVQFRVEVEALRGAAAQLAVIRGDLESRWNAGPGDDSSVFGDNDLASAFDDFTARWDRARSRLSEDLCELERLLAAAADAYIQNEDEISAAAGRRAGDGRGEAVPIPNASPQPAATAPVFHGDLGPVQLL